MNDPMVEIKSNYPMCRYANDTNVNLVHMGTEKYFKECAKITRCTVEEAYRVNVHKEKAEEYAIDMFVLNDKFPIPILDYTIGMQEGKHRILAVQWLIDKGEIDSTLCPVIIVK